MLKEHIPPTKEQEFADMIELLTQLVESYNNGVIFQDYLKANIEIVLSRAAFLKFSSDQVKQLKQLVPFGDNQNQLTT